MREEHDWEKTEYIELNNYARVIFDLQQKTAQTTFLINPALGAAYAYVLANPQLNLTAFALLISILGIVFNAGAWGYWRQWHKVLSSGFARLTELEKKSGGGLHAILEQHWDSSYKPSRLPRRLSDVFTVEFLTHVYFGILTVGWLFAFVKISL